MNTSGAKKVLKKNSMVLILFFVYIFFVIMTRGEIFSASNFTSLISQNAYVFVLGTGMLMCMLTGGNIDLSVGSFVCMAGAVFGVLSVNAHLSTPIALLLIFGLGIVYGVVLGFLIAYLNIPPWIATLAGYLAFRGAGTEILNASSRTSAITGFPSSFLKLFSGKVAKSATEGSISYSCLVIGILCIIVVILMNFLTRYGKLKKGYEADSLLYVILKSVLEAAVIGLITYKLAKDGGIPVVLVWVVAILLIYNFVCEKTVIGRRFMAVGGNSETARLSGINNKHVMFGAYLNMSVLSVIASLMMVARFQSANSGAGVNFEMDAISACVVGGVSAYGGSGTVFGMVIGATLIGVINLGMSLICSKFNLNQDWQQVVKGAVLLAAVVFDIVSKSDMKWSSLFRRRKKIKEFSKENSPS